MLFTIASQRDFDSEMPQLSKLRFFCYLQLESEPPKLWDIDFLTLESIAPLVLSSSIINLLARLDYSRRSLGVQRIHKHIVPLRYASNVREKQVDVLDASFGSINSHRKR